MTLHQDQQAFHDAVVITAEEMGIREVFIEKDYWVTFVLNRLSNSPFARTTIFKGGTSLSKAFKIIDRFSEDVDLAIVFPEGTSGSQIKEKIKSIEGALCKDFTETYLEGVTSKGSRIRRTVHDYNTLFSGDFGQATDKLLLEINSFANPQPNESRFIQSYIGEYLDKQGLTEQTKKYGLQPFEVQVVSISRTFVEKVMAVVRASYNNNPFDELGKKIRHLYDLHQLLQMPETMEFIQSKDFFEMLNEVRADDARNSEFRGDWAKLPLSSCKFFDDLSVSSTALKNVYTKDFRSLVYGEFPEYQNVIQSMQIIKERLIKADQL